MLSDFVKQLLPRSSRSNYYFRAGLSLLAAYLLIRSVGEAFFVLSGVTSRASVNFVLHALTLYLVLLIADQLFMLFKVDGPRFRYHYILQLVGGVLVPIFLVGTGIMLYAVCCPIEFPKRLYFGDYLGKIALVLAVYQLRYLAGHLPQDVSKHLVNHSLTAQFEPGNPHNYNEIACIFKEQGRFFASNFANELTLWPETPTTSILKLPSSEFYLLGKDMIINKKAISMVELNTPRAKIRLLNGLKVVHVFNQMDEINFQKWLENASVHIPSRCVDLSVSFRNAEIPFRYKERNVLNHISNVKSFFQNI